MTFVLESWLSPFSDTKLHLVHRYSVKRHLLEHNVSDTTNCSVIYMACTCWCPMLHVISALYVC